MKTNLRILITGIVFIPLALALAAVAVTQSERLDTIRAVPAQGKVFGTFRATIDAGDGKGPLDLATVATINWPLTGSQSVTVTLADGSTAQTTRSAIFAAVLAIATEERAAQLAAKLAAH